MAKDEGHSTRISSFFLEQSKQVRTPPPPFFSIFLLATWPEVPGGAESMLFCQDFKAPLNLGRSEGCHFWAAANKFYLNSHSFIVFGQHSGGSLIVRQQAAFEEVVDLRNVTTTERNQEGHRSRHPPRICLPATAPPSKASSSLHCTHVSIASSYCFNG